MSFVRFKKNKDAKRNNDIRIKPELDLEQKTEKSNVEEQISKKIRVLFLRILVLTTDNFDTNKVRTTDKHKIVYADQWFL